MKNALLLVACSLVIALPSAYGQTAIEQAVAHPDRPAEDRARDATRKPAEVLSFFDVRPGMDVLDIFAGGGYYAEILNHVVGDRGSVVLYNNGGWDGFVGEGVAERLAGDRLPNVRSVVAEANNTRFRRNSFDMALFVLGFHDLYFASDGWPAIDADAFLADIFRALKSGAVFGVVDHAATSGVSIEVANTLHRIDPLMIRYAAARAGFVFEGEADMLRNPEDPHIVPMSDPSIRGNTDRVVYKFRKP